MHRYSMTYYSHAIAYCSVIWHSLHKIDCYEMIFQISSQYLLRPVPQVQRLPEKNLYLHALQVENIVSGHVLTKAAWPNHNPVANFPREMHAATAASAHPRLATSSGGSALICRRANILRCVQVDARLTRRFCRCVFAD